MIRKKLLSIRFLFNMYNDLKQILWVCVYVYVRFVGGVVEFGFSFAVIVTFGGAFFNYAQLGVFRRSLSLNPSLSL